jgi:hypothetical protein
MLTTRDILDYEVHSSWWAGYISNPRLQFLAGTYFAWKVRRKYRRYKVSLDELTRVARTYNPKP